MSLTSFLLEHLPSVPAVHSRMAPSLSHRVCMEASTAHGHRPPDCHRDLSLDAGRQPCSAFPARIILSPHPKPQSWLLPQHPLSGWLQLGPPQKGLLLPGSLRLLPHSAWGLGGWVSSSHFRDCVEFGSSTCEVGVCSSAGLEGPKCAWSLIKGFPRPRPLQAAPGDPEAHGCVERSFLLSHWVSRVRPGPCLNT